MQVDGQPLPKMILPHVHISFHTTAILHCEAAVCKLDVEQNDIAAENSVPVDVNDQANHQHPAV